MKRLIGLAVIALCFWQQGAGAALLVMDFSFADISMPEGAGGPASVTFRLTYDSTAADTDGSSSVGVYAAQLALLSGGASSVPASTVVTVKHSVANEVGTIVDSFGSATSFVTPLVSVDGRPITAASFELISDPGGMFSNDHLPTNADFAANATSAFISLQDIDVDTGQGYVFVPGTFQVTLGTVPEPSAYVLLGAGLAALFWIRRTRRI